MLAVAYPGLAIVSAAQTLNLEPMSHFIHYHYHQFQTRHLSSKKPFMCRLTGYLIARFAQTLFQGDDT